MVLLVLVLTGSLGWIEALSGIFVIGSVASAYYVGSASLKTDAQGKTHAQGLLTMEIEVPDELLDGR